MMERASRRGSGALALAGILLGASNPVFSEDAETFDDASIAGRQQVIETILVVSTKQAGPRDVQTVPTAISAFGQTQIDAMLAVDLVDIGRYAPNAYILDVPAFAGYPNFYIRGLGVNGSSRTVDPSVGNFIDGIYVGYGPLSTTETFDMESVEILRGPQGTLFGRNVTGGAIVSRTRRPDTQEFYIDGKVTAGRFDRTDVAAAVNVPIAENKLAFKLAFLSKNSDGYYDVENLDRSKMDEDLLVLRPSLRYTPTENLNITVIGDYLRDKGGSAGTRNVDVAEVPKLAQTLFGYVPPGGRWSVNHDLEGYTDAEAWHLISDINWDTGPGVITSITGYREVTFNTSTDLDGTPFPIFHFPDNKENQHQFSQELRFATTFSETVEFVFGLYYFDQHYEAGERRQILGTINVAGLAKVDHENYSAFMQGEWGVSDDLAVVFGGRYTHEEKAFEFSAPGFCELDFSSCLSAIVADDSWENFSPKLGLRYSVNEDSQIYATWTKGFRSGTFNQRAQSNDTIGPADEETVQTWEIGSKNTFFDDRMLFNLAVFYSDYKDIQQTVTNPVPGRGSEQIVANAADATIWGVEVEFDAVLAEGLTVDGSLGYVDASYDRFDFDLNADGVISTGEVGEASSWSFLKVPEWTWHIAGQYETRVGNAGYGTVRVSYTHNSSTEGDVRNTPWLRQGGYGLLDASVTYSDLDDRYRVTVFGKNLTDDDHFDLPGDIGALATGFWGGAPWTWGIELGFSL